jgi:hypothetical protein
LSVSLYRQSDKVNVWERKTENAPAARLQFHLISK